jgi:hypothetical protein
MVASLIFYALVCWEVDALRGIEKDWLVTVLDCPLDLQLKALR